MDAKAYKGKVVRREIGPLWRRDNELYIRGRNRTSLAKGQVGNVWVMYPGALKKRLRKSGPLGREKMERVARRLDLSLPPA